MTLIAGYIHSDSSIHIVADSAETISNLVDKDIHTNSNRFNSFGEIIESNNNQLTEESAQKIYQINDNILITYSGQVFEGSQTLMDLKQSINQLSDKKTSAVISDFFKTNEPLETEYIIGFSENGKPFIFYYKNEGRFLSELGDSIMLGSGSQNELITKPFKHILKFFYDLKSHSINQIIFLTAILQSCSLNALTFSEGVGGFFNGAMIFNSQIYWAKDSCNILYSSKHFEKGERFLVNKFNRDGVTLITSPKIQRSAFFPNLKLSGLSVNEWSDKWLDSLLELNAKCEVDYYAFICYDRRIITIINRHNQRFEENISLNQLNSKKMGISLKQNLINKLLSYAVDSKTMEETNQGFGVVFNYI